MKFHENPFSGGRFVPCGQADIQTDMTKFSRFFAILRTLLKIWSMTWINSLA